MKDQMIIHKRSDGKISIITIEWWRTNFKCPDILNQYGWYTIFRWNNRVGKYRIT